MNKKFLEKIFPFMYAGLSRFWRFKLRPLIYLVLRRKKGTLIYVGGNHGESLIDIAHLYKRVIVFECNPILVQILKHRLRFLDNVEVYGFAASDRYGKEYLSIPNNGNFFGSGTILGFSEDYRIQEEGRFEVQTINLGEFLEILGVKEIDFYVSDIEGSDYNALASMRKYILDGRIKRIQVEVWSEKITRPFRKAEEKIYESDFQSLLGPNYSKINEGTSSLLNEKWRINDKWNSRDVLWERN